MSSTMCLSGCEGSQMKVWSQIFVKNNATHVVVNIKNYDVTIWPAVAPVCM